jgi:phosphoribosylformylglycinamidine synthase
MKFKAEINVMPLKELLDPQGKTVGKNMGHIGITDVADVRIGKHIEMVLEADDAAAAEAKVETACKRLLSNAVMESYSYTISQA